jgi:acylpyruvate hydrolase
MGLNTAEILRCYDLDTNFVEQAMNAIDGGLLPLIDPGDLKIEAPVPRPGKVICIGLNYRNHAIESGMDIPKSPIIFSKFQTCVVGPGDPIGFRSAAKRSITKQSSRSSSGGEHRKVKASEAMDYVFGYMNFNDVSARDFQFADGQWQRGKSCDTFAPMGPFVATRDEISGSA